MATQYIEELLTKFFLTMDEDTLRSITNSYELKTYVDETTKEEIQEEMWRYVWNRVPWGMILRRLHETLPDTPSESESEDDEKME